MGFKVFFWVGAVFPCVFADFCCSNFAKVLISLCFWCFVASHCTKPRAKTHFLNVFHVGFSSFAPEILVFLVGSNVLLGVQSFGESCFMWVLAALMKNPCDSCGF